MNFNILLKFALFILKKNLNKDDGIYLGWQANLAMAYYDSIFNLKERKSKSKLSKKDYHEAANDAAKSFLKNFM